MSATTETDRRRLGDGLPSIRRHCRVYQAASQRAGLMALHKLEYPYVRSAGMLESAYGRDPRGTIEIKKKPDTPAVSAKTL